MTEPAPSTAPKRWRFRMVRILGMFAVLPVVLILAAPWIVANTGLRDRAINWIVSSPSVTASSQSASFGWFSPLSIHGLETVRRLPAFTSKSASEELGRNLVKLVAYHKASGGQTDPALIQFLSGLPGKLRDNLVAIGLF